MRTCTYYCRVERHAPANGHPNGGLWRQWYCTACKGYFLETHGTPLLGTGSLSTASCGRWVRLAEGLASMPWPGFTVDPHTVLQWLAEVAAHLQASPSISAPRSCHPGQLDELYALLRRSMTGESAGGRLATPHTLSTLGLVAIDPVTQAAPGARRRDRTLAMAQRVVHQVVQVLAPGCVPLFLTDGFKEYRPRC